MNKPIKPNITIPESFAQNGVKTDFDDTLLADGFDNLRPDVLAGDNLNKFIDDTYQGLNYGIAAADAINLINEGETLTVVDGKLTSGANVGRIEEQLATKVDKFDAYKHSIPDYTNTIQVGSNPADPIAFTSYTAPVSGLLNLSWGAMTTDTNTIKILVNGHGVAWGHKTRYTAFTTSFPVNAGDVVTWQLVTGISGDSYVFGFLCPYKEGGN